MKQKKWRGTALFAMILVVMGLTIGLRLYGPNAPAAPTLIASASAPPAASSTPNTPALTAPTPAQPTPAQPTPAQPTPSPAPTSAPAAVNKTIDGAVEQTPYGTIQVSVTFADKKITAVTELQSPNDESRSVRINADAAPILVQEVLQSQSARIDTVSGATYTSDGYALSVQSAIDQL